MPHVPDTGPGKRVTDAGARTEGRGQPSNIRGGSRMQESCTYGSVRGAPSNGRPYRNRQIGNRFEAFSKGALSAVSGAVSSEQLSAWAKRSRCRAAIRRPLLAAEAGGATRAALSACERIAEQTFRIHLSPAASPANPMVAADLQIVRRLMVADSVTRRRLKLDQQLAAGEVYSSHGVFSSSAATPKITRAPALSFSNDDRSEIITESG